MTRRALCLDRANGMSSRKIVAIFMLLLVATVLLSSCAPSLRKVGEINLKNIQRIHIGDLRSEVVKRMGSTTVIAQHGQEVPSPYRTMTFDNAEGDPTEILYYFTGTTHVGSERDHTIIKEELTPIILEWGVVVGIGWNYLREHLDMYRAGLLE